MADKGYLKMTEQTCYRCRYWQTSEPGKDKEPRPTPMLRFGFAPCAKGEIGRYWSRKAAACKHYQAIGAAAQKRRDEMMKKLGA